MNWNKLIGMCAIGIGVGLLPWVPEPPEVTLAPIVVQGPPRHCDVKNGPLKWNEELDWFSVICPKGVVPDGTGVR